MKPLNHKEFKTRFPHVHEALAQIARDGHGFEAEIARQMIYGRRPNIEEKYDALLLKLDRSYQRLMDYKESQEEGRGSPLYKTRLISKVKSKILGFMLGELKWMKARNRDLIEMRNKIDEKGAD